MLRHTRAKFIYKVWGGKWIPRLKGARRLAGPVGESIEYAGPFMTKLIDARQDLSVQVHPSERYARRVEKKPGKAESWYVLKTSPRGKGGFIYLGFRGRKGAIRTGFERAVRRGRREEVLSYINKIRVHPGQVFHLPPGTIHAIGRGVRLFELQQTSDLTYRVWDWNRRPARTLHLKEAFEVLNFRARPAGYFRKKIVPVSRGRFFREERLISQPSAGYAAHRVVFQKKGASARQFIKREVVLTVIEGAIEVNGRRVSRGETVLLRGTKLLEMKNLSGSSTAIKSFCP